MLKDTLKEKGFAFKKSLGQNFLSDVNLLDAIVDDSGATNQTTVLEIGAGAGTLTKRLSLVAKQVVAVEIDEGLRSVLTQTLSEAVNVKLLFCDAMKNFDLVLSQIDGNFFVVANIPYYLTTELALKLAACERCLSATLLVQKEVALRFAAKPNCKDYSSVTVALQAFSQPLITRYVDRKLFLPPPDVDSAVVKMDFDRRSQGIDDYKFFLKVVRASFAMRRKTLVNNLKASFSLNCAAEQLLAELNLSPTIRGETLTVAQFVALSESIKAHLI